MRFLKAVFSVDRLIGYSMLAVFVALKFSNPYPVEFLKLNGVEFLSEPATVQSTDSPATRFVCFKDPDGTILELVEGT